VFLLWTSWGQLSATFKSLECRRYVFFLFRARLVGKSADQVPSLKMMILPFYSGFCNTTRLHQFKKFPRRIEYMYLGPTGFLSSFQLECRKAVMVDVMAVGGEREENTPTRRFATRLRQFAAHIHKWGTDRVLWLSLHKTKSIFLVRSEWACIFILLKS